MFDARWQQSPLSAQSPLVGPFMIPPLSAHAALSLSWFTHLPPLLLLLPAVPLPAFPLPLPPVPPDVAPEPAIELLLPFPPVPPVFELLLLQATNEAPSVVAKIATQVRLNVAINLFSLVLTVERTRSSTAPTWRAPYQAFNAAYSRIAEPFLGRAMSATRHERPLLPFPRTWNEDAGSKGLFGSR